LTGFDTDVVVTGSATPDLVPPTLVSATVSQSVVDVSAGTVVVDYSITVADQYSGISYNNFNVMNQNFEQRISVNSNGVNTLTLSYIVGLNDDSLLTLNNLNFSDNGSNNVGSFQQQLSQLDVTITGTATPDFVINGAFSQSEGNFPGARGNPSYLFDVTSTGQVAFGFSWVNISDGATLAILNSSRQVVETTDDGGYNPSLQIAADLTPGTYSLYTTPCCFAQESFVINAFGPIIVPEVDTDSDGIVDAFDTDDDDDGIDDTTDNFPLDWTQF